MPINQNLSAGDVYFVFLSNSKENSNMHNYKG